MNGTAQCETCGLDWLDCESLLGERCWRCLSRHFNSTYVPSVYINHPTKLALWKENFKKELDERTL